ncbi:MAG: hypothetical protein ABW042_00550 [Phenylobacterium sp.]
MQATPRSRRRRFRGASAAALSVAIHAGILAAVLAVRVAGERVYEEEVMPVAIVAPLYRPPPPEPEPAPMTEPAPAPAPAAAAPMPSKPPPLRRARLSKPAPAMAPLFASDTRSDVVGTSPNPEPGNGLSEGQIAGARTAGSGGGAGCDMVQLLQAALRKDPEVQAAIRSESALLSGKAILLWSGDWVRSSVQEGKGLAGVRQAIIMEVGFAPAACRNETLNGRVLISLGDAPGSPRVVIGDGSWRWSQLLHAAGAVRSARLER